MTPGFKRVWTFPKRASRGATLRDFTPQGRYLYERSKERAKQREATLDDVIVLVEMSSEFGLYESFRFIHSGSTWNTRDT